MRYLAILARTVLILGVILGVVLLSGCVMPTEPDSGCTRYTSDPFFSGKQVVAYQCWGDALPGDSLDHPEWW